MHVVFDASAETNLSLFEMFLLAHVTKRRFCYAKKFHIYIKKCGAYTCYF